MAIINTHDQLVAAGRGIALIYHTVHPRDCSVRKWSVYAVMNGKVVRTKSDAPWYDYGQQTFLVGFGLTRMQVLEKAKQWVATNYAEDGPWVRNRMGDYVPKRINDQFPIPKREVRNGT